jgi:regulator of RNase E activity RraA
MSTASVVTPITRTNGTAKRPLDSHQLDSLRRFPTPTIANAIETFEVRPHGEGFTDSRVQCLFPHFGVMLGYACTATIHSAQPAPEPRNVDRRRYWEYIARQQGPKVSVVQDLSEASGGAYWGEVNSSIHQSLGSQGVLTNGTVRDLEEVSRIGFHFFAMGVHVSHGHAHLEEFNRPVKVFGMMVRPGDLIHADRHGAVTIPHEIAAHVADAAAEIERQEKPMLAACRMTDIDAMIDELDRLIPRAY